MSAPSDSVSPSPTGTAETIAYAVMDGDRCVDVMRARHYAESRVALLNARYRSDTYRVEPLVLRSQLDALVGERERARWLEAAANLVAMDVCWFVKGEAFVGTGNPHDDRDEPLELHVNCNDYFAPAADSELVPLAAAPALLAAYRELGQDAVWAWVAARRGIPNKPWRRSRQASLANPNTSGASVTREGRNPSASPAEERTET